jgi:LPXTG-site transpeptidase (sortase) family protein
MALDGVLVPPGDFTVAGWWADGPVPGARRGTAVITGHTVHTGGGVFDDLADLEAGDLVVVMRRGSDLVYTVRSVRTLDKSRFARRADALLSPDAPGRLALITCGEWSEDAYLSNVVALAVRPAAVRD